MRKLSCLPPALLLYLALAGQMLQSQFVINSYYNPAPGDTYMINTVDTAGIYPGTGGENQTWNFSNLIVLPEQSSESFVIPGLTPYYSQFPNSNLASVNSDTPPFYHYYINSDTGNYLAGYAFSYGLMRYYTPLARFPYPVSYGSQISRTYFGVSVSGNISRHFRGSRTFTCDGYGTIVLPGGQYNNVMRVKTVDEVFDTTFSGGIVIQTGHEIVTYYQWFRAGYKFPFFSIVEINPSGQQPWKTVVLLQKQIPISVIQLSSNVPVRHKLYENYPNPFNSQTRIRFDVASRTMIRITVYAVTGREIECLLEDTLPAGTYSVNWNAERYASGVYFYRIEAGEHNSAKRMVLLK